MRDKSVLKAIVAFIAHILALAGSAYYAWRIYQYYMEFKPYMKGLGLVLTFIHVAAACLLVLAVLIASVKSKTLWTIAGVVFAAAVLTGMRYYVIVYFTPPLWRSLLLLIPGGLFGLSVSLRMKD
ncbi:MAG: hypothetical protein LBN99_07495 [Oscillospiraceae bacterium]|jgi:hypothetical protein|nr:hypothetical protein [Oscillospiraceae bacterium]